MPKNSVGKKPSGTSSKEDFIALWDLFVDIYLDPLFFAFAVFILFTRIQFVMDFVATRPEYSFWVVLEADMHLTPALYIGFFAVFFLWAISKGIRYRREKRDRKQLTDALQQMNTSITNLQQAINNLPDKIAESMRSSGNIGDKPK